MLSVLSKLFVARFYGANAGFFFLLFFVAFGAVQGGSLVTYHLSLMQSIFESSAVLLLVCSCWVLYHAKCTLFFLRTIESAETGFLFSLQTHALLRLWLIVLLLYTVVYAPVLVYAVCAAWVGMQKGFLVPAVSILLFQVLSITGFAGIVVYRLTHWQQGFRVPSFGIRIPKPYPLYLLFYFTSQRKVLLVFLKSFSIFLLFLALVWNKGPFDADAFLLFYLVILMAHSTLPYFTVGFFEKGLAFWRNLPLSYGERALAFLLPYSILLLPEGLYLFYAGVTLPAAAKWAYLLNIIASLFLLTAFLYSDARNNYDYLKAAFGLFFVSIFALHAEAYWFWILIQCSIAWGLFVNGFYRYEADPGRRGKAGHHHKREA